MRTGLTLLLMGLLEVLRMWDKRVVGKIEKFVRDCSMACSFRSVDDNSLLAFTGTYRPNLDSDGNLLWEELV